MRPNDPCVYKVHTPEQYRQYGFQDYYGQRAAFQIASSKALHTKRVTSVVFNHKPTHGTPSFTGHPSCRNIRCSTSQLHKISRLPLAQRAPSAPSPAQYAPATPTSSPLLPISYAIDLRRGRPPTTHPTIVTRRQTHRTANPRAAHA